MVVARRSRWASVGSNPSSSLLLGLTHAAPPPPTPGPGPPTPPHSSSTTTSGWAPPSPRSTPRPCPPRYAAGGSAAPASALTTPRTASSAAHNLWHFCHTIGRIACCPPACLALPCPSACARHKPCAHACTLQRGSNCLFTYPPLTRQLAPPPPPPPHPTHPPPTQAVVVVWDPQTLWTGGAWHSMRVGRAPSLSRTPALPVALLSPLPLPCPACLRACVRA